MMDMGIFSDKSNLKIPEFFWQFYILPPLWEMR